MITFLMAVFGLVACKSVPTRPRLSVEAVRDDAWARSPAMDADTLLSVISPLAITEIH